MAKFFCILMTLLVVLFPTTSLAASFDCAKSSLALEKIICADSVLTNLDEKLAALYKVVTSEANKTGKIKKQQKEWLRNIRNKCTSKPCLVDAYETRINEFESIRLKELPVDLNCPVSEKMLVGSWESESAGFFEEMAFEYAGSKREFNSWLHQRPEIMGGSWKIEKCTLYIRHPTEEKMNFAFPYVRMRGDRLYLREDGDQSDAVYKRIKL